MRMLPLLLVWVLFANPAHAYIDPGTGSMVVQFFIATVAGIAFAVKSYWHAIKAMFSKKKAIEPEAVKSSKQS